MLGDAADICGGASAEKVVHFTDADVESSATIGCFLTLAVKYHVVIPPLSAKADDDIERMALIEEMRNLVEFLHKYE